MKGRVKVWQRSLLLALRVVTKSPVLGDFPVELKQHILSYLRVEWCACTKCAKSMQFCVHFGEPFVIYLGQCTPSGCCHGCNVPTMYPGGGWHPARFDFSLPPMVVFGSRLRVPPLPAPAVAPTNLRAQFVRTEREQERQKRHYKKK